jgi:hypothetical protein
MYGRRLFEADSQPFEDRRREGMFTLEHQAFDHVIPAWMELYERADFAIQMLAGLHYIDGGYVGSKLMTVCAVLEALHRGLDPRTPLSEEDFEIFHGQAIAGVEKRFRPLLQVWNGLYYGIRAGELAERPDEAAISMLLGDRRKWLALVKLVRNGMGHGTGRDEQVDAELQFRLLVVTRALCQLVLAQELRVPASQQFRYVTSGPTQYSSIAFKKALESFVIPKRS